MSPTAAFREGLRRVNAAPALLAGTFAVTLLVSLPLAYALEGMIAAHLDSSLAADAAAAGTNPEWWREFQAQATGLGTTFMLTVPPIGPTSSRASTPAPIDPSDAPTAISPNSRRACRVSNIWLANVHACTGAITAKQFTQT